MTATALHGLIERYNVLIAPTKKITHYLSTHPAVYKAAMVANHIFRALSMHAMRTSIPFSPLVGSLLCFGGSVFYRLTVEKGCAYKFALPAFAGSLAFSCAQKAIRQATFQASSALFMLPLAAYAAYVILTIDYDVENSRTRPS